jgi:plastocyanin
MRGFAAHASEMTGRHDGLNRPRTWYVAAVLLLALSTGHKLGLGLAGAGFAGFSLVISMLVPRRWPQFPGRGLPLFVAVVVFLFVGMLAAVEIFGKSSGEAATAATKVAVTEVEYKIQMPKTTFAPGTYDFDVSNNGTIPHNLTITGPGVSKEATQDISARSSGSVTVKLERGTYDFYCSIPGHKQQGMDVKVTVS